LKECTRTEHTIVTTKAKIG